MLLPPVACQQMNESNLFVSLQTLATETFVAEAATDQKRSAPFQTQPDTISYVFFSAKEKTSHPKSQRFRQGFSSNLIANAFFAHIRFTNQASNKHIYIEIMEFSLSQRPILWDNTCMHQHKDYTSKIQLNLFQLKLQTF